MERDFVIKLAFGVHRLAKTVGDGALAQGITRSANSILANTILLSEGAAGGGSRRSLALKTVDEIGTLEQLLWTCRAKNGVAEEVFGILFREYGKIKTFCSGILAEPVEREEKQKAQQPSRQISSARSLSFRQNKIVEILQTKEKAQVWELQKILPEVTKRTLRRDLDDLLGRKLIERQGEWNAVFYRLKR
ncbi:MAG: DeoR family transcriptional regulator [Candidatus Wildermuthbacteria bacterium]|nr:DeoR family transcriptional regulator [Candidatus Wildermuthbacteria bacterium]MBI2647805.1 DeoR family transcriptional regulator [Candidatus Wildermuthbacteria bacterium]